MASSRSRSRKHSCSRSRGDRDRVGGRKIEARSGSRKAKKGRSRSRSGSRKAVARRKSSGLTSRSDSGARKANGKRHSRKASREEKASRSGSRKAVTRRKSGGLTSRSGSGARKKKNSRSRKASRSGGRKAKGSRSGSRKASDGKRGVERSRSGSRKARARRRSGGRESRGGDSLSEVWDRLQKATQKRESAQGSGRRDRKEESVRFSSLQDEIRHEKKSSSGSMGALGDKLRKCLDGGHRTASLRIMASMLEKGADIRDLHIDQLLEQAALRPGAVQFAMALGLVGSSGATVGVEAFLRGLGALIQQGAPAQQVRLWLNLGLPRVSPALPLLPDGFDAQEKAEAERELEEAAANMTDDESRSNSAPSIICFTGCLARPELNGRYQLSNEMTCHHKPVYEKLVGQTAPAREEEKPARRKGAGKAEKMASAMEEQGQGDRQDVIVIHYRKKQGADEGWVFTRKTTGGEELAWTSRSSKTPPPSGWLVARKGGRQADSLRIADARGRSGSAREEALRVMSGVDAQKLRGRLLAPDGSDPAAEYFGHFCALLHLEHLEELRQLRRKARRAGPELQSLECGGVFGRKDGRKSDALGWEDPGSEMGVLLLPSNGMDQSRLKKGDSVRLVEAGDSEGGMKLEGTIADLKPSKGREAAQMVIKVRGSWPDNAMTSSWSVFQSANGTLYERQLQALLNLITKPRNKVCELLIAARVGGVDSWVARWRGKASNVAAPVTKSRAKDQATTRRLAKSRPAQTKSTEKLQAALDEVPKLTHLNSSQRGAVGTALEQACTIIQGPPGTGKTHVSVQILKMWAGAGLRPLLATSDSNVAVDNIAMGLRAQGVNVMRVGRPEKVNQIINEITLETVLERELLKAHEEMKQKEKDEKGPDHQEEDATSEGDEEGKGKGKGKDKGKAKGLTPKMRYDLQMRVLRSAEVICATSIAAGGDFFSSFSFAGILIDEAAQATELSAIVPVILRGTQQLVCVGDHCQLPPTVQSSEAEARGLSVSLYTRLMEGGGLPSHMLDTQYRSHPLIAAFSARAFYQGKLGSGVTGAQRPPPLGPSWPRPDVPLCFRQVASEESTDGDSKMNVGEADVIAGLLRDVLAKGELGVTDVGIVTPYLAQVRCLRRVLRSAVPNGTDPMLLEIASVDNFQGREKELIIFSAVRSNRSGAIGFLADWRRLNVMVTRARRGLVICGNEQTLRSNEHWKAWLDFYKCAAGGKPLPRTPSPERRKREEEAKAEEERLRREMEQAEAEAEAEAAAAEKERKKRAPSPRRRPPSRARSPARSVLKPTSAAAKRSRDTRPMSQRLDDEEEVNLYGDGFWGDETTGGDAAAMWESAASVAPESPPQAASSAATPANGSGGDAKSAAQDALARMWAASTLAPPSKPPAKRDSSSEIELMLDSD